MRDLDLAAGVTLTTVVAPVSVAASGILGTAFDTQGYEGVGIMQLQALNTAGTNPTLDVAVYDCATSGGSYVAVSPALAFVQATVAGGNTVQNLAIDFSKVREFIKVYPTLGGTASPAYTLGVSISARKKYL